MNQTEVLKNKIMRGQILRTLVLFYPSPVDIGGLKTAMLTRGALHTADMTKVLHYLEDKEYIRLTEGKLQELCDSDLVELTAAGVDLIEGTTTDAGVEV